MNCPKCNANLSWNMTTCDQCGLDVAVYRRVLSASNLYYNDGLTKAKVHDLSGAVISLKKSLQLNKKNTNSRNLLGLVYYEMGEIVSALSEWVLSKHFQSSDNVADEYMSVIQSNPSRLEVYNQSIKKYNSALSYAKQKSEDLAIIQLKKVTSLNPYFLRAHNLLALLYMMNGEKEKAKKCLRNVMKIDVNNTIALKYLHEMEDNSEKKEEGSFQSHSPIKEEHSSFSPISTYKEDKPNLFAFVNILLGIVIGLAVGAFLIIPTVKKNIAGDYVNEGKNYSEQLSTKNSEISSLENANKKLTEQVKQLEANAKDVTVSEDNEKLYDSLFLGLKLYMEEDDRGAAMEMIKVTDEALENIYAQEIYKIVQDATFVTTSSALFEEGRSTYNSGKFEESLLILQDALKLNPENVDALYFLGRAYHRLDNKEKAKEYYNTVVEDYPESSRVAEARTKLKELN